MTKSIPLILFSGGLDSTYLLEQELRKGPVDILYVEASQCPTKVEAERQARCKIISTLQRITGNCVREQYDVVIKSGCHTPDHTFQQPLMWLNGAFEVSDAAKHSGLMVGYVMGDQINAYLGHIVAAWNGMQGFGKHTSIPIDFPLMLTTKQDILDLIHPEIVSQVWICEAPDYSVHKGEARVYHSCKKCLPCKTMKTQLYLWRLTHGEDYGKFIIRKLNELKRHCITDSIKEA